MSLPTTLLLANVITGDVTLNGSAWAPRAQVFGEGMTLAIRARGFSGAKEVDLDLDIRATKVSFGDVDARPESGTFKLQMGTGASTVNNTTGVLTYNCTAAQMQAAINAVAAVVTAYGAATVSYADDSFFIVFANATEQVPMQLRVNELAPVTLPETNAVPLDSQWVHELRLVRAQLTFCSTAEAVLPPPPVITGVLDGGSAGGTPYPEKQALTIPPAFRGGFYIQTAQGPTKGLTIQDTSDTIQAALEAVLGKGNITVTDAADFTANIEFVGDLIGLDQDLLTVVPTNPPPGDLTLTLDFNLWGLLRRLRAEAVVTEALEVTVYVGDAMTEMVLVRQDISVVRRLNRPELETVPNVDWLRPASAQNYSSFSRTTVITGQQFVPFLKGNGVDTVFNLTDGLATGVKYVFVREDADGGRQLVQGVDFSVTGLHSNTVTVTALLGAPATNAWLITVMSAQTVAAFADGLTVTMDQVTGLNAALAAVTTRVTALEEQAATAPLGLPATTVGAGPVTIEIPDKQDAYPVVGGKLTRTGGVIDLTALPRAGWLLPAIHDASVTAITDLDDLPTIEDAVGNVYSNGTDAAIEMDGGGGFRASLVPIGGFFGGDGRGLYPLSRQGSTTSYFPRDFERTLFEFILPGELMRAGAMLALGFKLATLLAQATSGLQCVLVVEHGTTTQATTPSAPAPNLLAVTWNATPLLTARLVLGDDKITYPFGAQVIRKANGDMAANQIKYGLSTAAGSTPAVGDLALRGRLLNADPEDGAVDATGTVFWALTEATAEVSST